MSGIHQSIDTCSTISHDMKSLRMLSILHYIDRQREEMRKNLFGDDGTLQPTKQEAAKKCIEI